MGFLFSEEKRKMSIKRLLFRTSQNSF